MHRLGGVHTNWSVREKMVGANLCDVGMEVAYEQ